MATLIYGKIFASMFEGSMFGAGSDVFAVMAYVVSHMQPDRQRVERVHLNPELLSKCIGETEERMVLAIKFLCERDKKESGLPDEEGRRLVKEGPYIYRVVNGRYYRELLDEDDRREKAAKRQAEYRARKAAEQLRATGRAIASIPAGGAEDYQPGNGAPVAPEGPAQAVGAQESPGTVQQALPEIRTPDPAGDVLNPPSADEPHKAPDKRTEIESLHRVYGEVTGQVIDLTMDRERIWFEWMARKFSEVDLRLVVRHLKAGISQGKRNDGSLRFSNLIGNPDLFEEDLAACRKGWRVRSIAEKERVDVRALEPKAPGEKPLSKKTPEELAAETEMFRRLQESLVPGRVAAAL